MASVTTITKSALASLDRLIRGTTPQSTAATSSIRLRIAILITAGCCYGAIMGAFGGIGITRWPQIACSAAKVPLMLSATFLLSLPSFYVLNTLLGLRGDWPQVLAAISGAQAILTIVLASLSPFTALWYLSCRDYAWAILFNGAMFAFASTTAQVVLRRAYRELVARRPAHRVTLCCWLAIYIFVGIQMGWILRPFVGNPDLPTRFLRANAMSNAYVVVGEMILDKLR
jgi:uncharacterized membrane protein YoaK (UPF0700 family)